MKKIIIFIMSILLVSSSTIFAMLQPPYVSIFTRVGGRVSSLGNEFLSTSGIEFMIGKKLYFYGQIRVSTSFLGDIDSYRNDLGYFFSDEFDNEIEAFGPGIHLNLNNVSIDYGGLVGFGTYLLDNRNENGRGFSIVGNLGVGFDLAVIGNSSSLELNLNNSYGYGYRLPIELNFTGRYNFFKNFALQFGINIGLDVSWLPCVKNNSFTDNRNAYTGFKYGFDIGLAF